MKLHTPAIGLLSLAMLGTTPAFSDTLLDSFEGTAGDSLSDWDYDPQYTWGWEGYTATITGAQYSETGVTEGDTSAEIYYDGSVGDSTAWTWVLGSTSMDLYTAIMNACDSGGNVMAIDITTSGYSAVSGSAYFAINATSPGWAQASATPTLIADTTVTELIDISSIGETMSSTDTWTQFLLAVPGGTLGDTTGAWYFDNMRIVDTLWTGTGSLYTWCGNVYTYDTGDGWFWSEDNGLFQYASGSDPTSVYVYDTELGWTWTSMSMYPYYYVYDADVWAYYYTGTADDRCYFTWLGDGSSGWTDAAGLLNGTLDYTATSDDSD